MREKRADFLTRAAVKPPIVAGTYKYFIKAKDTSKLYSIVADEETLVINKSNTPVINVGSSTVVGSDYKLVWSNAESTFQIKNYFIYRDGVLTKTVSDIEEVLIPITWNVPVTFTVKAKDIAGNLSDLSTGHSVDLDAIVLALGTPAPVVANTDYIINLDVSVLSLPLSHIVIKYGGTSWTVGSTVVGTQNSTVVVAPINWDAGTSRLFRFVAYDIANRQVMKLLLV